MNIVNFTPITATLGGMIIGLAVVIFFLFNGRLVGISGIAANALTEKDNKFDNFDYTKEESEAGYKNFCVIRCKIKSIEWLYLAAKGHRRALFDLENNKKNWLVP